MCMLYYMSITITIFIYRFPETDAEENHFCGVAFVSISK